MKRAEWGFAFLAIVLALVLLAVFAACDRDGTNAAAPPVAVELKFSYHTPESASLVGAYFKPWTAAIERASNGTIHVTHYPGESLVKEADQYDAVVNGICDIALIDANITPGRFPKAEFYGLPGLFPSAKVAAEAYLDVVQQFCAADEFKDVQILGAVAIAPAEYVGNKPAQKPDDLRGQRVRSGGKIESWMIQQLGGKPIEISTGDMLASLQRGLMDSAFLTWSLVLSSGVKDITQYRTQCDLFYRCWVLVMNKRRWDSLTAEQQSAVEACSGISNSGRYSSDNEAEATGAAQAIASYDAGKGNAPIYVLSDGEKEEWKEAAMPVWDRWVNELEKAHLPGQAILDATRVLIEKYSTQ
jgi:C4-dicarboxylate-binding protein DctP